MTKKLNLSDYPQVMNLDETCEFLRISKKTFYNYRSSGESLPPSIGMTRNLLFKRDEVGKWLNNLEVNQ